MNHFHTAERDLTVQEACAFFYVTPPTVYKMIANGELKSYKVGRARRITIESIQALRNGKNLTRK